jgi:hypothetical protein
LVSTRACDVFAWNCGVTNAHRGLRVIGGTDDIHELSLAENGGHRLEIGEAIRYEKFSIWDLVTKSQSTTPRYPNNFVFLAIPV